MAWFPKDHPYLSDNKYRTPPALIVEILSPSNRRHDLVRKRAIYAEAGVPHYWIADPSDKSLLALELRDGEYHEVGGTNAQGLFAAPPFAETSLTIADIFPWPDA